MTLTRGNLALAPQPAAASPAALKDHWAKSDRNNPSVTLSVHQHSLDTFSVALELLSLKPRDEFQDMASELHMGIDQVITFIAFLVMLHDLGKMGPGFQRRLVAPYQNLLDAGLPRPTIQTELQHWALTYAIVLELLERRGWARLPSEKIAQALAGHHGYRPHHNLRRSAVFAYNNPAATPQPWKDAIHLLIDELEKDTGFTLPEGVLKLPDAFVRYVEGFSSPADWVASMETFFTYYRDLGEDPGDFLRQSRLIAAKAVKHAGFGPAPMLMPEPRTFEDLFGFPPRPLQLAVEEIAQKTTSRGLHIIEAGTGEGKTQAALHLAAVLQKKLGHNGLYWASPTQATSAAHFRFIERELLKAAPKNAPFNYHLVHGNAILDEHYRRIQVHAGTEEDPKADVVAREWFLPRKRALLAPFAVGTADQILLMGLHTRHNSQRAYGLANKVIVLDEVHSYELYTTELMRTTVRWLLAMGCTVIMLSATLPKAKRDQFLALGGAKEAPVAPYPRITMANGVQALTRTFQSTVRRSVTITTAPEEPSRLARYLLHRAYAGANVGCIVNTVKRGRRVLRELRRLYPEVPMHFFHAQMPAAWRNKIARSIQWHYGRHGHRPKHGGIVVATQVMEQSLDLDFDFMVSDPAPIDILLQRAGRLARHERARPKGFETPILAIAGFRRDRPPHLGWGTNVYEPLFPLRTWSVLRHRTTLNTPEDFEPLIEAVYGDTPTPEDLSERDAKRFERALDDMRDHMAQHYAEHRRVAVPDPGEYYTTPFGEGLLDDDHPATNPLAKAQTRLSLPRVKVVLLFRRKNGYLYLSPLGRRSVPLDQPIPDEFAREIYGNSMDISNQPVVKTILETERWIVPEGWWKNPILRGCLPLVLENRQAIVGDHHLHLDKELGLIITPLNDLMEGEEGVPERLNLDSQPDPEELL